MADQQKIGRRTLFAGVGAIAAAALAAKLAPKSAPHDDATAHKEPEGNGYRLTEHVKKYYRTTTI